jgi:hypothetical protein
MHAWTLEPSTKKGEGKRVRENVYFESTRERKPASEDTAYIHTYEGSIETPQMCGAVCSPRRK